MAAALVNAVGVSAPEPAAQSAGGPAAYSLTGDPNFAVVCAFIERFGAVCGVPCPNIGDLQDLIESKEVKDDIIMFQVRIHF